MRLRIIFHTPRGVFQTPFEEVGADTVREVREVAAKMVEHGCDYYQSNAVPTKLTTGQSAARVLVNEALTSKVYLPQRVLAETVIEVQVEGEEEA